ncbi:hypothetical protein [Rhodopirellula europaea]|uniref:hypothetical protein n=1 Tax=Rhodopirellula europaea TaxID=1263866 RepID=UPI003D270D3D
MPRLQIITEDYFQPESPDDPLKPLRLTDELRERLDQAEPNIDALSKTTHLALVTADQDGKSIIREKAERAITHEPVRSTKLQTASGVHQEVSRRDDLLADELAHCTAKFNQHEDTNSVAKPRVDKDGNELKPSKTQQRLLQFDYVAFALMLGFEGIVATTQVKGSYLPAGDYWVTAAAMGIPAVLGLFYALRARPLDLKHDELPGFNNQLTRRGVQLSILVIVLFAFLLGESSGGSSNIFSGESSGPGTWTQSLFTLALMLSLAFVAKNIFRLIQEQQAAFIEFVPVPNLHRQFWKTIIDTIEQTRTANAAIANEMLVIQARIHEEASLNADREEDVFEQHGAAVKGAHAAAASQAAERISNLFSQN